MSAPKWHEQSMVAYDTETTGTNPLTDRIVTAALVHLTPGQRPRPIQWLIDPGTPIPDEAAAVHGWTTQRVADTIGRPGYAIRSMIGPNGQETRTRIPAETAVYEIAAQLGAAMAREAAIVVHNAAYDLTLTEAECARHDVPILATRPHGITGIVDPFVIAKQYDPYRKTCYRKGPDGTPCDRETPVHHCGGCRGSKKYACGGCGATDQKLESLCAHYGIRHGGAHDAAADAIAAARLARRLMDAWPQTARYKLDTLHDHQVTWRRDQANGLRAWFDKNGIEHDGVDPGWPTYTTLPAALRTLVDERGAA